MTQSIVASGHVAERCHSGVNILIAVRLWIFLQKMTGPHGLQDAVALSTLVVQNAVVVFCYCC